MFSRLAANFLVLVKFNRAEHFDWLQQITLAHEWIAYLFLGTYLNFNVGLKILESVPIYQAKLNLVSSNLFKAQTFAHWLDLTLVLNLPTDPLANF